MGDQGRESKRADAPKREVRFAPINGHRQLGGARPISANTRPQGVVAGLRQHPRGCVRLALLQLARLAARNQKDLQRMVETFDGALAKGFERDAVTDPFSDDRIY
jgi:hypothetical protein